VRSDIDAGMPLGIPFFFPVDIWGGRCILWVMCGPLGRGLFYGMPEDQLTDG